MRKPVRWSQKRACAIAEMWMDRAFLFSVFDVRIPVVDGRGWNKKGGTCGEYVREEKKYVPLWCRLLSVRW